MANKFKVQLLSAHSPGPQTHKLKWISADPKLHDTQHSPTAVWSFIETSCLLYTVCLLCSWSCLSADWRGRNRQITENHA